jgi:hypothetical protein
MDPQMSYVLAARVALERLAVVDREHHAPSGRPIGAIVRLARRGLGLVEGQVWPRRSSAPAARSASTKEPRVTA